MVVPPKFFEETASTIKLLANDGSLTIHQRNIHLHASEIFTIERGLVPAFMSNIFLGNHNLFADNISSNKTIAISEQGTDPSILESFLIDEKKTTLNLLVSRLMQRLNGQKWLTPN